MSRSTICTRRPSGVRSISSWSLNGASAWLFSRAASSSRRSASRRRRSTACAARRAACGSTGARTWPSSAVCGPIADGTGLALAAGTIRSAAPPGPRVLAAGTCALPTTALGFLKYSDTAARSSLEAMPISHITRKKAIIAVTKSA
nr:hypothetical protein [Pseudoxanthomonas taiwanensis]